MNTRLSPSLTVAAALALGGCASFTPDQGLGPAIGITRAELAKDVVKVTDEAVASTAQERAEALLRRPLTADSAVQIAILKNRGLQAAFNELGVAEAVYVKATLPPSPRFSASRLAGSFELEIERQILIGLFELATLPQRAAIAEQRFRAAQFRTAEAVLRLAADARRQYYRTVAANQQVAFLQQALATAESASELAKQLGETGALNKLEQAREHAFYTELGAQLARARIQQRIERERLIRQLGLWGRDIDFRLPASLPALPGQLAGAQDLEREAMRRRVDVEALRYDLRAVAGHFGLANATRFVTDVELAGISKYERTKSIRLDEHSELEIEREKARKRGLEVDLEIPIYDFGQTSVRNAQETYMAAANRLAERAVNARSEIREAYLRYRGNYDLARYYQSRVLPLRRTIQDETLLHYSGMLVDVTRLIVDARARILSNIDAINARRDFWIAATDLKAALVGGGAGTGAEMSGGSAAAAGGDTGAH
ncbi:MAG: TolC family protein [Microvirga sp.]|jgi:outer membrane protein TolC|nr:TolC family protein [Microvirga sp.]MCE3246818.1 TolC family protein [Geminicoccaceae bacterium]MDF2766855.1 TolC family protein [Rhodospirillales bacterium]MDF2971804.1 TolC family protein [Microvirga sp.]